MLYPINFRIYALRPKYLVTEESIRKTSDRLEECWLLRDGQETAGHLALDES